MAESSNLNDQNTPVVSHDVVTGDKAITEASPKPSPPGSEEKMVAVSQDPPAVVIPEASMVVLERLARQVEYYFSTANLERDTYVATLRSLNDGYVPLTIIANFGKVKALVAYDALNAVRRAAIDCSELLEVVHIDTHTGKRLDQETASTSPDIQTVEAVGPKSGQPIPMSSIATAPAASASSVPAAQTVKPATTVQNTVIIREVPEGTEESHIRELFAFEKCPPIQSLHLDIANCWFVTLDTSSQDDMIHVMFTLRTKKFAPSGESVKARLKSAVVMNTDVSPPVNYGYTSADASLAPQLPPGGPHPHGGNKKMEHAGKRKKNNPNGSSKGKNINVPNKNAKGVKNSGSSNIGASTQRRNNNNGTRQSNKKAPASRQDGKENGSKAPAQSPPTLGEDHFPSLPTDDLVNNKNKIEVEKVPDHRPEDDDEMEKARGGSDSASTATTTSSSSSSKNASTSHHQPIGYAAALLKAAPPMKPKPTEEKAKDFSPSGVKGGSNNINSRSGSEKKAPSNPKIKTARKSDARSNSDEKASNGQHTSPSPVSVQTPSWGGGRSFADVLRIKEASAAVAAAPEQSA